MLTGPGHRPGETLPDSEIPDWLPQGYPPACPPMRDVLGVDEKGKPQRSLECFAVCKIGTEGATIKGHQCRAAGLSPSQSFDGGVNRLRCPLFPGNQTKNGP